MTDFCAAPNPGNLRGEANDRLSQSRTPLMFNIVRVYKALDGGWRIEDASARDAVVM